MSKARLVITAVIVEGRSVGEAAAAYGVSRSWAYELVARYHREGDIGVEPRSRRPHRSPRRTPDDVVELILELRQQLEADGLDAGAHTIAWHLEHHHRITVSASTVWRRLRDARRHHPPTEEAAQELLHPLPGRPTQRDLAVRHDPLAAR